MTTKLYWNFGTPPQIPPTIEKCIRKKYIREIIANDVLVVPYKADKILNGKYLGYLLFETEFNGVDVHYYVLYLDNDMLDKWNAFRHSKVYKYLGDNVSLMILEYIYNDMIKIRSYIMDTDHIAIPLHKGDDYNTYGVKSYMEICDSNSFVYDLIMPTIPPIHQIDYKFL